MNFNLTIQEAIPMLKLGKILHNTSGIFLFRYKNNLLQAKKIHEPNDEWGPALISSENIDEQCWAIYEEPKEERRRLYKREVPSDKSENVIHFNKKEPEIGQYRFAFESENECNKWRKALNTFMCLKSHPLAVPAENGNEQFIITFNESDDDDDDCCYLFIEYWRFMATKLSYLSPCFNSKENAEKAISEIGKENILHMFKTFQGVYE